MEIRIVVVCEDLTVLQTVETHQGQLVPERFRRRNHEAVRGASFNVSGLSLAVPGSHQLLIDHIGLPDPEQTVGIIVISAGAYKLASPPLSDIYFMSDAPLERPVSRPDNLVSALIGRALTDFVAFTARFDDKKWQKILRLPNQNFQAEELTRLRAVCRQTIDQKDFGEQLDKALKAFKPRIKPKRKEGNYPNKYIIDDHAKHFEFGHEEHAQADTGPPHTTWCVAANRHRFGRGFRSIEQYNVSRDGGVMNGTYLDCHGSPKGGDGEDHLNMFTNGFF
jgi:hypothetical protein